MAAVVEILEELLELEHVRSDDDFFELGGHSLMGAQLVARLEDQFDVEIDLLSIFDNPTAAGIAPSSGTSSWPTIDAGPSPPIEHAAAQ